MQLEAQEMQKQCDLHSYFNEIFERPPRGFRGTGVNEEGTKVHSMHLGPKISGVELAFPSPWRRGYCLNYNLWRTGAIKSRSPRTVRLIFAPQVYANLQLWRTPEMLLAYLRREVYTECTLGKA